MWKRKIILLPVPSRRVQHVHAVVGLRLVGDRRVNGVLRGLHICHVKSFSLPLVELHPEITLDGVHGHLIHLPGVPEDGRPVLQGPQVRQQQPICALLLVVGRAATAAVVSATLLPEI